MRTYLISYDLAKPAHNQHVLAQVIMGLGDKWARPLSNTWYVNSNREEVELESELKDLLGEEDGLLIQAVKREAILTNTSIRWFRQRRAAPRHQPRQQHHRFPCTPGCRPDRAGTALRGGLLTSSIPPAVGPHGRLGCDVGLSTSKPGSPPRGPRLFSCLDPAPLRAARSRLRLWR